jgi:hypothetical protein
VEVAGSCFGNGLLSNNGFSWDGSHDPNVNHNPTTLNLYLLGNDDLFLMTCLSSLNKRNALLIGVDTKVSSRELFIGIGICQSLVLLV